MSATRMKTINIDDDQSEMARQFTVIWCLVSPFKSSKIMQQQHDLERSLQGQCKENHLNVTKVFKAITHRNKYILTIYDASCMLIFEVDF